MRLTERPTIALLYKETVITLKVDNRYRNDAVSMFSKIDNLDRDYDVSVKKRQNKRSKDANAYCWVLISKIAENQKLSITEVYKRLIQEMYVYDLVPIRTDAVDRWIENWRSRGLGWVCEDLGESKKTPGYHIIKCHYGSSTFTASEMATFIDIIIQECKQLDIEHLTSREIEELKQTWGG